MISVEVRGAELLASKYRRFDPNAMMTRTANTYMTQARLELMEYPPPPGGSRYRRTGRLGRGWVLQGSVGYGSGGIQRLRNATRYAPYVQGNRQARVHRGRWVTVDKIAAKYGPRMLASLRRMVQEWIRQ